MYRLEGSEVRITQKIGKADKYFIAAAFLSEEDQITIT